MSRSILGQLIPEAMVYFLENHGPKKFSATFLGEFDTPEAIWSSEMRYVRITCTCTYKGHLSINYTSLQGTLFLSHFDTLLC